MLKPRLKVERGEGLSQWRTMKSPAVSLWLLNGAGVRWTQCWLLSHCYDKIANVNDGREGGREGREGRKNVSWLTVTKAHLNGRGLVAGPRAAGYMRASLGGRVQWVLVCSAQFFRFFPFCSVREDTAHLLNESPPHSVNSIWKVLGYDTRFVS